LWNVPESLANLSVVRDQTNEVIHVHLLARTCFSLLLHFAPRFRMFTMGTQAMGTSGPMKRTVR
jgi:hypothetical protein